jgi:hypothetical protein
MQKLCQPLLSRYYADWLDFWGWRMTCFSDADETTNFVILICRFLQILVGSGVMIPACGRRPGFSARAVAGEKFLLIVWPIPAKSAAGLFLVPPWQGNVHLIPPNSVAGVPYGRSH